jgi:hypothetical protein
MRRLNWLAIVSGASVAVAARLALGFLLALSPVDTVAMPIPVLAEAIAGFFAFAFGGCVTGIVAGRWGGLNGLAAALVGTLVAVLLGMAVVILILASAPPQSVRARPFLQVNDGSSLSAAELLDMVGIWALILLWVLLPFVGGYLGGKLGEWLRSQPPS